jgi:lambda repressor-like predicted transcriptional regulator
MAGQDRKREAALAALLTEATLADAAVKAGVSTRALKNWLAEPGFAAEYRAARAALVEAALLALQRANAAAVETLVGNLACDDPAVEIRAAKIILEQTIRLREHSEFEDRLAAVEAAIGGKGR